MHDEIAPPDSSVAKRALELSEPVAPRFLVNHSLRTYAWGCLLAGLKGIKFDKELFYVAAVLHDIGLTKAYDGPRCFEHESAAVALNFAVEHDWETKRCYSLAEAIYLHMQARVVLEDGAEAFLLSEATTCDVRGKWLEEIGQSACSRVLEQFPRLDFKAEFLKLFADQADKKPGCRAGVLLEEGLVESVQRAPFDG